MKTNQVKNKWLYRGHKIDSGVVVDWIRKRWPEEKPPSEGFWHCAGHFLTVGPARYRKELRMGILKPEAAQALVYMAKFVLSLKAIKGEFDEFEVQPSTPGAA